MKEMERQSIKSIRVTYPKKRFTTLSELVYEIYPTIWVYNNSRIHTALNMSPREFARRHQQDTIQKLESSVQRNGYLTVFAAGYCTGAEGKEGDGEGCGDQNSGHMMMRSQNQNESCGW